jgi:predicted transcriptional regulator
MNDNNDVVDIMDKLIGFVTGNPKREKILSALDSKQAISSSRVAKTAHIIEASTEKILLELVEKGLAKSVGDTYSLTETGREIKGRIGGFR